MKKKKECEKNHFKTRVKERFNLILDDHDVNNIIGMIKSGQSKSVGKTSLSKSNHVITYEGKTMEVVYQKERKTLVTALIPKGETDA